MRLCGASLACVLAFAAWPAAALGEEVTGEQLRALATAAARHDRQALDRLRAVDVVDGRWVRR